MSTKIVISCPECSAKLKLKSRASLGKRRDCPRCGHSFVLRESKDKTKGERPADPVMPRRSSQTLRRKKKAQSSKQKTVVIVAGCVLAVLIVVGASMFFGDSDPVNAPEGQVAANDSSSAERKNRARQSGKTQEQKAKPADQQQQTPPTGKVASTNKTAPSNPPTRQSPTSNSTGSNSTANWSRFRGPDGTGVSDQTGVPLEWSAANNIAWKTPLPGPGASSPITYGDHVYVTYYSGYGENPEAPGSKANLQRQLACLNRDDGSILWTKAEPSAGDVATYGDPVTIGKHGYSSSTPVADESGVYVFFGTTGLVAWSHEGQMKWKASCGTKADKYGTASSPILHRDLVIIHADVESQSLIAFDKTTGSERWRLTSADKGPNAWNTPPIIERNGRAELIYVSGSYGRVAGVDPVSGSKLWEFDKTGMGRMNACVVAHEDILYFQSGPTRKSVAIQVSGGDSVTKLWELNKGSYISSPVFYNGHVYWVHDGGGIAYCADIRTGNLLYEQRIEPRSGEIYASPVVVDGNIYYVSRLKGTYVLPARPEFEILAHNVIDTDKSVFNGSPAVSDGQLLLRSDKCLYCIGQRRIAEIAATPKPGAGQIVGSSAGKPGTAASSPSSNRPPQTVAQAVPDFKADTKTYSSVVRPFLERHCLKCHGPRTQEADFRIDDGLPNEFLTKSVIDRWSEVLNMLNAGDMPPEGEPRPPTADAQRVVEWIEQERLRAERARNDRTIVLRRMNREEYNNTIRDLIGIDFEFIDEFPEDPPAGGFDNNGGALTISPLHSELYLKAAQRILDRAIVDETQRPTPIKWHFEVEEGNQGINRYRVRMDDDKNNAVIVNAGNNRISNGMVLLRTDKDYDQFCGFGNFFVPHPGDYVIRIRAAGITPPEQSARQVGPQLHVRRQEDRERKMSNAAERQRSRDRFNQRVLPRVQRYFAEDRGFRYGPARMKVTGQPGGRRLTLAEIDVDAPVSEPKVYEVRAWLTPVLNTVRVKHVYRIPRHQFSSYVRDDDFPRPELLVDWMEIEGPMYDGWPPSSHKRILIDSRNKGQNEEAYARDVLANFMRRAYRRPLEDGELESKVALFSKVRSGKPSFEEAIKLPLMAVLASPHFLYLVEEGSTRPLNDYELATRLSYFLWSSMPDDELFGLAESGKLNNPATLRAQVDRMLADDKNTALVKNFTGQWLRLREVGANPPVVNIYPRYDAHLEVSLRGETEAFFAHILRNDLSVFDFLDSDYVTINERLARFYDIRGVKGDHFRPVQLPQGVPRGGLLTQASILSITSNGTRTSPVWRGVWVLENLLGDPPPPPPPNAGDIPTGVPGLDKVTIRQRLRLHREHAQCARCHNKIDPLGFALENFNAAGEWRDQEASGLYGQASQNDPVIDASAQLPDGTKIVGVEGLQRELLKRQDQFLHCLSRKMYTYALGRELGYADQPVVKEAVEYMKTHENTLRSLIQNIVTSDVFRTK